MPSSPFRPAGSGASPAEWPRRPDPPRDLRHRLTQLTGRLRDRARSASQLVGAWRQRSGSSGDRGDVDETPSRRSHPGRSQTRLVGAVIAALAVVAIGGSVVGRALERRSEQAGAAVSGSVSGPVVVATPPTGGLPLVAGTIGVGTGVPGPSGSARTAGSSHPTSTTTSLVAVHAAGAVARPGVYLLPVGARATMCLRPQAARQPMLISIR